MAVKFRNRLSTQISLLGLSAVAIMSFTFAYIISYVTPRPYADEKIKINNIVTTTAIALAHQAELDRSAGLSAYDILVRARSLVTLNNRSDGRYFWLQTTNCLMLAHSINPELIDDDMSGYKDVAGNFIFKLFTETSESGGGFVEYSWPRPGNDVPVDNISYVISVDGTDWVLGCGLFSNEVSSHVQTMTLPMAAMAGVILAVVLAACILLGQSYTRPVNDALAMANLLKTGDLSGPDINDSRKDELGLMARELNSMKNSLKDEARLATAAAFLTGMAAGEIAESNRNLSSRIMERASASGELARAMEDLEETIDRSADLTGRTNEQVAKLAGDIDELDVSGLSETGRKYMEDIGARVWSLATDLSDAAAVAWEQSVTLKDMNQSAIKLDQAMQKDVDMVEQVAQSAKNMEEESKSLIQQMKRFKLT